MAEPGEYIDLDVFDRGNDADADQDEFADTSFSYFEAAELSGRATTTERLTQLRTELTDLDALRYMREMGITDEDTITAFKLDAKVKNGNLYYKDLKLTYNKGRKVYAVSTLKSKPGGSEFVGYFLSPVAVRLAAVRSAATRKDDVLNLRVGAADLTTSDVGLLRDEHTRLRGDETGPDHTDQIKKIDALIEQYNNENPEFRALDDELKRANMKLSELYKERDKLLSLPELTAEQRAELAKIDDRIEFYFDQENYARERIAQTKSLREVIRDPQLSLRAKLTELFQRRGLTIGSLLVALGMTVSAIALGVTKTAGGGAGSNKPDTPTPDGGGPYSKAQQIVRRFGDWLKSLASKSAAALPGIIGSIVSFILRAAGTVVGFIGEQLWIFLVAVTFYLFNRLTI